MHVDMGLDTRAPWSPRAFTGVSRVAQKPWTGPGRAASFRWKAATSPSYAASPFYNEGAIGCRWELTTDLCWEYGMGKVVSGRPLQTERDRQYFQGPHFFHER